ncbi:glycerol-3-phosphate-acyltransferase [Sistotremastrum niveocremeum HHB9708]|uniref:Glycerol-3-phosphate-acyltransferase n=1 Tax=Sistotremastrum niveocremeum HHB9708 TaxID=1314777 RepID=A0A165A0Q3_9AGAM|nr:glycerol-3-phosphate-acyltransferase [Sistotremastrum niveocremeum HHB9708]
MDNLVLHRVIRRMAKLALAGFYSEIRVIGEENVPRDGPLIIVSTHHNMMIDPSVLSSTFPHKRPLHYWAKSGLFVNPVAGYILKSAGNIPVDRKSKDNKVLFKGTFDCLAGNQAVALFPEGTSYTECRIMQVKDGASYAALEYTKWIGQNENKSTKPPTVVVAGITYTNKSKYRSRVAVEFGPPISVERYMEQFMSEKEGESRAAAKRLTRDIEQLMIELTINAKDWETLFAARIARELLWESSPLDLDAFVSASQTLVDLFSTPDMGPDFENMKLQLLAYDSLLESSRFTNSDLAALKLPSALDPRRTITVPSRLWTLLTLLRDTVATFFWLPLFIFPLLIHLPVYITGRVGGKFAENEEETQAQNKIVLGFLLTLNIYSTLFLGLWWLFSFSITGGILAFTSIWGLSLYHRKIIDENYSRIKRMIAAWRVLVGVWIPSRWDMSLPSLKPYTTPFIPPVSPWIGRVNPADLKAEEAAFNAKRKRPRGPPSRRLVRHVLNARLNAAQALGAVLRDIEKSGLNVRASSHLARQFGGKVEERDIYEENGSKDGVLSLREPSGWRAAKEVVAFLREKGAKIGALEEIPDNDWAVVSSDGEGEAEEQDDKKEDVVWVQNHT